MRRLIAAFVVLLVAGPLAAAEKPSDEELLKFFADVAYGSEYGVKGSGVTKKWSDTLRVNLAALDGKMIRKPGAKPELKLSKAKPTATQVGLVRQHLRTLVKLTGIKPENARKTGKQPNLLIKFVPRLAMHAPFLVPRAPPKLLKRLAGPGVCYFLTADKQGKVVWATVVVNNQLSEKEMSACLLEELTQVLGLTNDSDIVQPSIFNNLSQPTALNRTDEILVRTLYDPRLTAGMGPTRALGIARQVIAELNKKLP